MMHDEFESIAALDAVGAASADEEAALRAHLATCESCRRARDEFEEAAALIGRGLDPVPAPRQVWGNVMDAIGETDDTLAQRRSRLGSSRWWLATAATLFFALWGWRELAIRAAREKVASRDAEIRQLTEQNALLMQRTEKLTAEISSLGSSETRTIVLAGQQTSPAASAKVFLEPSNRRAVVFFHGLPINPHDKSYQLWMIRADQIKPQSVGVFDVSPAGGATISVEHLPVATEIKALAVTMEPKGGVEQPTNTNFYLMGKT